VRCGVCGGGDVGVNVCPMAGGVYPGGQIRFHYRQQIFTDPKNHPHKKTAKKNFQI